MKTWIVKLLAAYGILLLFAFTMACNDDDDDNEPDPVEEMRREIKTGSWSITYFFDEADETDHFTGYAFVFNDDKTVRATNGTVAVSGMWELLWTSNGEKKLVLDFAVTEPFDELNDDWDIKEYTESKILLEDVSGGSSEIDYLRLEKL